MVNDDSLVRKRWKEWKRFNYEWSHRSYDDLDKYLEYTDKRYPELTQTAIKWKIFRTTDKDNMTWTREFESFYKPIMKSLFEVNEETGVMDEVVRRGEVSVFVEYGFVQIIAKYIGIEGKQFYDLPRRDPNKLRTLFEVSRLVYGFKDYELNKSDREKAAEDTDELLKERREFKKKIRGND